MLAKLIKTSAVGLGFYLLGTTLSLAGCVSMESGAALGAWIVVNNCSDTVMGKFCYDDDSAMSCQSGGGGFGPLHAGETETVTPPGAGYVTWHTSYCDYDAWMQGTCRT